jgi:hypothetical protein
MKDIGLSWAKEAGADLSAALYKIAKLDGSGNVVLAGANQGFGVITEAAVLGKPVTVQYGGQVKVLVGASPIAAGAPVGADSNGLAVTVTSGAAGVLGVALQAGAASEIIEIAFTAG